MNTTPNFSRPQSAFDLADLLDDSPSLSEHRLTLTIFPDLAARNKETLSFTLPELAERMKATRAAIKSDLPLLSLASYGDTRSGKGGLRHDGNVIAVHGISVDYDAGEVGLDEAEALCEKAGVHVLIHPTSSHNPAEPRWRALFPLHRPVNPAEAAALVARANGILGGIIAPESFTLSQSFYFGFIDALEPDCRVVDGWRYLDHATDITPVYRHGGPRPKPRNVKTPQSWGIPLYVVEMIVDKIENRNDGWTGQFTNMAGAIWNECGESGRDIFHKWAKKSDTYNKRETDARYSRADGIDLNFGYLLHEAGLSEIQAADFDDATLLTVDDIPNDIRALNRVAAKVMCGGKARVWHNNELVAPEEFHKFYAHRTVVVDKKDVPLTRAWWNSSSVRTYRDGVVFAPGQRTTSALNIWQGWDVDERWDTSCELFLNHVRFIAGEHADWFLDWMAHLFQKPWEKPGTAVVIRGSKGAGKDTIGNYLGKILGRAHIRVSDPRHLVGNFNAHLQYCLLLHVEEGTWGGDRQAEGILKSRITADTVTIERKGIDPVEQPNYSRIFISSNSEWVVPATADERRWYVLDVETVRSREYFDALHTEMRNGGPEALLFYLLNRQITSDLRKPPVTAALTDQVLETLSGVDRWWFDILTSGQFPLTFDDEEWSRVDTNALYKDYADRERYPVSKKAFGKRLKTICPSIGRHGGGKQGRWYLLPSIETARRDFSTVIDGSLNWD